MATVPYAITSLSITSTTKASITVGWSDNVEGGAAITKYLMWIDNGAGSYSSGVEYSTVSVKAYTFSLLVTGTTYKIKMQAYNSEGYSSFSNEVTGVAAIVPTAPVIAVASTTKLTVTLTWEAPDNGGSSITKYSIYYTQTVPYSLLEDFVYSGTTATYTTPTLTTGVLYYFYVIASNGAGASSQSNVVSSYAAVAPAAPTAVNKVATDSTSITLGWAYEVDTNGGTAIKNFEVYYDIGSGYSLLISVGPTVNQYIHSGLTSGSTISYKVRALSEFGYGDFSTSIDIIVNA
jgi:hypothetical protein